MSHALALETTGYIKRVYPLTAPPIAKGKQLNEALSQLITDLEEGQEGGCEWLHAYYCFLQERYSDEGCSFAGPRALR
jgi:hypothetical protein